jgi:hypothetical protein
MQLGKIPWLSKLLILVDDQSLIRVFPMDQRETVRKYYLEAAYVTHCELRCFADQLHSLTQDDLFCMEIESIEIHESE